MEAEYRGGAITSAPVQLHRLAPLQPRAFRRGAVQCNTYKGICTIAPPRNYQKHTFKKCQESDFYQK